MLGAAVAVGGLAVGGLATGLGAFAAGGVAVPAVSAFFVAVGFGALGAGAAPVGRTGFRVPCGDPDGVPVCRRVTATCPPPPPGCFGVRFGRAGAPRRRSGSSRRSVAAGRPVAIAVAPGWYVAVRRSAAVAPA